MSFERTSAYKAFLNEHQQTKILWGRFSLHYLKYMTRETHNGTIRMLINYKRYVLLHTNINFQNHFEYASAHNNLNSKQYLIVRVSTNAYCIN